MSFLVHAIVTAQYQRFRSTVKEEYGIKMLIGNPWPADIKPYFDRIEKSLELLKKSWSQMAGRNLISDILRENNGVEPLLKPNSKKAAQEFKQGIGRGYGATKARYHSALCLGYKVKTVSDEFTGDTADRADMMEKADKLLRAIKAAHGSVSDDHKKESTMLKIFMAPEFYFRGKNGGYDFDAVNGTGSEKSLIEILREKLDHSDYKDWLFILGTVIVVSKSTKTKCLDCMSEDVVRWVQASSTHTTRAECKVDSKHTIESIPMGAAVDNVALIVKEKFVHSVTKELVSVVDYKMTSASTRNEVVMKDAKGQPQVVKVVQYPTANPSRVAAEAQKPGTGFEDERMGGAIFTIDGVTFGCEICLDHFATKSKEGSGRLDGHAGGIHVQLIPSGGMGIAKFRTIENGLVFNVDGDTPHVAAAGLTSAGALQALQAQDGDVYVTKIGSSWEQLEKWVTQHKLTSDPTAPAPAAGPDGPVYQFGPFELPVT
jgi:hypothetical protein